MIFWSNGAVNGGGNGGNLRPLTVRMSHSLSGDSATLQVYVNVQIMGLHTLPF